MNINWLCVPAAGKWLMVEPFWLCVVANVLIVSGCGGLIAYCVGDLAVCVVNTVFGLGLLVGAVVSCGAIGLMSRYEVLCIMCVGMAGWGCLGKI